MHSTLQSLLWRVPTVPIELHLVPCLLQDGLLLSGALRHAFFYDTMVLFDAFNDHLEAGSETPVQRTDETSSAGALNCMIVGGGVALRFNGRSKHIPTTLTIREVDVLKFIAVGALAGEHTDSVHLELKKCFGFLELEVDHVIGFGKALRSTLRNREPEGTTKWKSSCASDGRRRRQSRHNRDLTEIVI